MENYLRFYPVWDNILGESPKVDFLFFRMSFAVKIIHGLTRVWQSQPRCVMLFNKRFIVLKFSWILNKLLKLLVKESIFLIVLVFEYRCHYLHFPNYD